MRFVFHPEAEAEAAAQRDYYDNKEDDHIVIYAVAHTKRKPGYWRERLNDAVQ